MRILPYFVPQNPTHYPFLSMPSITEENEITEDKISELQLQSKIDQQTIAKGVEETNALKKVLTHSKITVILWLTYSLIHVLYSLVTSTKYTLPHWHTLWQTIVELEGVVDSLKAAKQTLESQAKTDAIEIASLKKRILELESQVKGLTEESSRAQAEIAGMRKRIAELEGDVKNNLAEIVELKKRIASLERELEASKVGNKLSSHDKTYPFIT